MHNSTFYFEILSLPTSQIINYFFVVKNVIFLLTEKLEIMKVTNKCHHIQQISANISTTIVIDVF